MPPIPQAGAAQMSRADNHDACKPPDSCAAGAGCFSGRRRLMHACSMMGPMMRCGSGRGRRACPGRKRQGQGHQDRKHEIGEASHRYQPNGQTTLLRSYAQKQPEKPANCSRLKFGFPIREIVPESPKPTPSEEFNTKFVKFFQRFIFSSVCKLPCGRSFLILTRSFVQKRKI